MPAYSTAVRAVVALLAMDGVFLYKSIDIETRWGVPRFDDKSESESYLLMGQQLSDRLYRRTDSLARQADKQFYPMTEWWFQ